MATRLFCCAISESQTQIGFTDFEDAVNSEYQLDFTTSNDDLLTINVYDTLVQHPSNPFNAIFSNIPANYFFSDHNNTKGALLATAFRTRRTDDWNYKFYRYDARGRVAKMWTYLDELGWHWEGYSYNSQNQVIVNHYDQTKTDSISFMNNYDVVGRLSKVTNLRGSQIESTEQLTAYTYNPNSQILTSSFKTDMPVTNYSYNNRNWVQIIRSSNSGGDFFIEAMNYNANGNINNQSFLGDYANSFSTPDPLSYHYVYDKSNRLLKADASLSSSPVNQYDITNTYDHDGNITHLRRYEDAKYPTDEFSYEYQSGTNKLLKVRGEHDNDYSYDQNGNLLIDNVNDVWGMKYDFRNLLLSCNSKQHEENVLGSYDRIYYSEYKYDEAGNRVNKTIWEYADSDPHPDYPSGNWSLLNTEFYVHDVSGAEIAVYTGYEDIKFWNIWGTDNVGKIDASDNTKQFYIKDHLGSVRCVLDEGSTIVSSQDYDAWGHKMEGRKFQSELLKYRFTSKERDIETDYDYFGARYYDSRIGRWGGTDKMLAKDISVSGYVYCGNNPMVFIDEKGLWKIYYKDGKEVSRKSEGWFVDIFFPNTYYVQSDEGNVTYNGEKYFEALSKETVTQQEWEKVVADWTRSLVLESFKLRLLSALMPFYAFRQDYLNAITYAITESPGGFLDQKLYLDQKSLYIFNGIAMNFREAGNVIWGAAIKNLGIPLIIAETGAQGFSIYKNHALDQRNEVQAFHIGYYDYNNKSKYFVDRNKPELK